MNKYYNIFINENEKLINDIEKKSVETGAYRKLKQSDSFNQILKLKIGSKNSVILDASGNGIVAIVDLNKNSANIVWKIDRENFDFKEIKELDSFIFFRNPKSITIKNEYIDIKEDAEEMLFNIKIILDKENIKLYVAYNLLYGLGINSIGSYEINIKSNFKIESEENKIKHNNNIVWNNILLLKILKKIEHNKFLMESILDYIILGKEIDDETKDLIVLYSDIKKENIKIDKSLTNINSFTSEYNFLTEKTKIKHRKGK